MKNAYFGILAGGSGTRLWPLSSSNRPKQIIPFLDGKSLLEQTIERVLPISPTKNNIFIVTKQDQVNLLKPIADKKVGFFIEEPCGRNTAPAILLSCLKIHHQNPEAIIVFLTSDHFVPKPDGFYSTINTAIQYAQQSNKIAILGLKPSYPATGYGYIQAKISNDNHQKISHPVSKFHEKPDLHTAKEYIKKNNMFWNIGNFVAKASVFIDEFNKTSPGLVEQMKEYLRGKCQYSEIENISFDYAVLEKSKNIVIFPTDFEWHDVGNLNTFITLQNKFSKQKNRVINVDGANNIASTSKKNVACIGLSNVCIVETEDTILVVKKDEAEKVKFVVNQI
jgi:mannose-1-phosphate guanylyltransferase